MSSKPTEVIAVILHHHVQTGHEEQVLHHGSGKPVLVIGDRESFVNINSMDTACARGAAAAAEHLWQAGCRRFFVLGAPHPDEQNIKRNGNGNGFGPRRLTAILQTLNRHGITIPPNQCIDCERTLEGGREAAWRLLDREFQTAPPTPECGILCLSDTDRDRRIARADGARHPHT